MNNSALSEEAIYEIEQHINAIARVIFEDLNTHQKEFAGILWLQKMINVVGVFINLVASVTQEAVDRAIEQFGESNSK